MPGAMQVLYGTREYRALLQQAHLLHLDAQYMHTAIYHIQLDNLAVASRNCSPSRALWLILVYTCCVQ